LEQKQFPIAFLFIVPLFVAAFSRATFGYLLLSVTSFINRPETVAWLWTWRNPWAVASATMVAASHILALLL
jgi:hypothetical protein